MAGTSKQDEHFIQLALDHAHKGEETPGGAQVGAVLVRNGEVICAGFNEGDLRHDPTAHAEMVTIRRYCADNQVMRLDGCTIYCTLQPCGMCTMACLWAGVSRIVYGAGRDDVNSVYFESRHFNTADFIRDAFRNDIEIVGEVLKQECAALYMKKDEPVEPGKDPAHDSSAPAV